MPPRFAQARASVVLQSVVNLNGCVCYWRTVTESFLIVDDLLGKVVAVAVGLIVSFGGYWAMSTDRRLTTLETKQADDKLQSSTKLAKLEAYLEKMTAQLDRIYEELRQERDRSNR
jgi:uncharacterized coiled-coil protein SlyX